MMRLRSVTTVLAVCGLLGSAVLLGASADYPVTQASCAAYGATVTAPTVWKQLGTDQLENLVFAYGSLWISDPSAGSVRRFGPDGSEGLGATGLSPGGLAVGPDGLVYVGSNDIVTALAKTGAAKVVRFDQADPDGSRRDYAVGLNMANGMTFGPNADLYVSNDFDKGLVRIPWTPRAAALPVRAGAGGWHLLADVYGTNGLVVDPGGGALYAAITFDQRSPVERIQLAGVRPRAPHPHSTYAQLSAGVLSLEPAVHADPNTNAPLVGIKGLDDMTQDAAGILYVVANGTGELIQVDPSLPEHGCLIAGGLSNPSSVRIAPAGSAFDTSGEAYTFYITEFSGRIMTIGYTP